MSRFHTPNCHNCGEDIRPTGACPTCGYANETYGRRESAVKESPVARATSTALPKEPMRVRVLDHVFDYFLAYFALAVVGILSWHHFSAPSDAELKTIIERDYALFDCTITDGVGITTGEAVCTVYGPEDTNCRQAVHIEDKGGGDVRFLRPMDCA